MGNERFIFWFWESPKIVLHVLATSKNTLIVSNNMHVFLLYLLKTSEDSFNDSFLQTPPLRDSILRWLVDWSHFHVILPVMPCFLQYMVMADKAVFVVLLCVQRYRANRYFYLQKQHQVTKTEFVFSFRPKRKHQQVGGWYANITWWHQHETAWDSF